MFINRLLISAILLTVFLCPDTEAQKSLTAKKLIRPMKVDGEFENILWQDADSAVNFLQMSPNPGIAATEETVVYTGYDDQKFYIVFRCYQKTPPVAKIQSRDQLSKNDDMVGIILDTYKDNRTGDGFLINPLGSQVDFKINDDGKNIDINWDAEWESVSHIYDQGWDVEIAIPFKSLKYKDGLKAWGINFGRIIRSNFETSYWSGTLTSDFRISQGGILEGIQTPDKDIKINIFPYSTLNISKSNNPETSRIKPDAGADLNFSFSPNVSLNGTINPDFATVEADEVKINLTRYELSYPEKRLFFQEGNEMYNTRFKTFYSRRIQDIDFGEKLNGKVGPYQFNILNVGSSVFSSADPYNYFTAASVKRDFLKSSTLGLIFVDKSGKEGFTRSLSLDYVLNLGKLWMLTGQFVASSPGSFADHSAWYLRFARENDIYHYHLRFNNVGKGFRENVNQTGFVTDDDRKELDGEVTYKWWIKNNLLEYISAGSNNNIFWSQKGVLRSWNLTDEVSLYLRNKISFTYSYDNEYKLFEKEYYNQQHTFGLGYNTDEWSHAMISYTTGRNFDRNLNLLTGGTRFKLIKNLSVQYTANLLHFNPDPGINSTLINILSVSYNFSKDLWLKVFAQNSTASDKFYFYGMFGWRFKPPFGAFYLIYSHDQFNGTMKNEKYGNLFLKLTYPVSILK
jgi:hypothetical protein